MCTKIVCHSLTYFFVFVFSGMSIGSFAQCEKTRTVTGKVTDGLHKTIGVQLEVDASLFVKDGQNLVQTLEVSSEDGLAKFSCELDKSTFEYHKRLVSSAPTFVLLKTEQGALAKVTQGYDDGKGPMKAISYGQALDDEWCLVCLLNISEKHLKSVGEQCIDEMFKSMQSRKKKAD